MDEITPRLLSRIAVSSSGCWEWTGARRPDGYGVLNGVRAHRLVYEAKVGPIPEGLDLDHLCRVRHCVNPDHLEPVTRRVNTLRGEGPAAVKARQTHCVNGHLLAGDNLYVHPKRGTRNCRTCLNEAARQRRAGMKGTGRCSQCDRPASSRGMCPSHYMSWWRGKDYTA